MDEYGWTVIAAIVSAGITFMVIVWRGSKYVNYDGGAYGPPPDPIDIQSIDADGWHTICPECDATVKVAVPVALQTKRPELMLCSECWKKRRKKS